MSIFGNDDEETIRKMREEQKRREREQAEKLRKQNEEAMRAYDQGVKQEQARRERLYNMSGGKKSNICGAQFKKHGKKMRCTKKKGHWFGHG
jgi:hypothetical protein